MLKESNPTAVRTSVGLALTGIFLSACSLLGSRSIPEIQAICDGMRGRVIEISSQYPDEDSYSEAGHMATLSGKSDREALRKKILGYMPYLSEYTLADYESGAYESGRNDWRIKEALLLMSKTPAPLSLTEDEWQQIEGAKNDGFETVVQPKIEFYLGPAYRPDGATQADGCEEIDDAAEVSVDYDNQVEFQWDYYHHQMDRYARNYFWILSCQQTGELEGEKCAGQKYVSKPTNLAEFCNSRLKITTNSAEPGVTCGKLRFEVFQSDYNTGACMALGWWNDKNGVQQVGAFYACGLEEGLVYDQSVTVGNPTTYTNSFGAEKTVITFSLNS